MHTKNYREILRLVLESGHSCRSVARLVGVSANTVRKYKHLAREKGWSWADVEEKNDAQLIAHFKVPRNFGAEKVLPDWHDIHKKMQVKHQTLIQLWDEYREEYKGDAYAYSQFTHLYREFMSKVDITMRQIHYAGECAYVDYAGQLIEWWDVKTNSAKKAQVFVATLGCSNYTFAWASASQRVEDWIEAHNRMLYFFGGVPSTVVPDNLKSAVIKAGRFPQLNKTYQELAEHYGTVIIPARVRRPQDKSKAELGVQLVTRWITIPLLRMQFFSIDEINQAITPLLTKLNGRSFKRLPGCRRSRFEELDKPALKPLPDQPFEYGEWVSAQKVGPDYHIYVKGHAYSVPYRIVGEKVEARISLRVVEIFHLSKRVASHIRNDSPGEHTTNPNHRPESHQAYASQTIEGYLHWAHSVGPHSMKLVKAQFEGKPDYSLAGRKACAKLTKLARLYSEPRFEAACKKAADISSLTFTSVQSILQHKLDETVLIEGPDSHRLPDHPNVRGSDYYSDGGPDDA